MQIGPLSKCNRTDLLRYQQFCCAVAAKVRHHVSLKIWLRYLFFIFLMCMTRENFQDKQVMTACLDERLRWTVTFTHLCKETHRHSWNFTEVPWFNNTHRSFFHLHPYIHLYIHNQARLTHIPMWGKTGWVATTIKTSSEPQKRKKIQNFCW